MDRERIAELAKAYVCPLNLNPSTPYELGAVKQYTTFALMVIEELGYTRPAEPKIRCQDCEYHHCYSGADGQDCSCGLSTLVTPTTNIPPPNCPLLHPAEPADKVEAVTKILTKYSIGYNYESVAREILKICQPLGRGYESIF